ncbi:type III-B CRISPR-associated protein Cas10/Cmr2 [Paraneptunicella aestuarii]|uniref:type III-B CRISPR-associated protein Cas10/Cmr2 n=1 Tax=Paraneptunicella aestuarii TaxID=2831148 RepID=UPI001E3D837F|nr:type III-B CRISPR-associated protein Cas10/Cmr2 [Paraneptunicella aestuarii]UAA40365.1 type III-B CRISPR-associated protein Cas10/Cmr2 [Paraneptunicella aestuarii]
MSKQYYFHFSIGPVHRFVMQARRTRDYWAGSFLLSWLTGIGLYSAQKRHGESVLPLLPDDMGKAFSGEDDNQDAFFNNLRFGRLPNKATIKLPENLSCEQQVAFANDVIAEIRQHWRSLADRVWCQDIEPFLAQEGYDKKQDVVANWQQQVEHFFDIRWCINNELLGGKTLRARGMWRTPQNSLSNRPSSSLLNCMLIKDLPELSGQVSQQDAKDKFWNRLRDFHRNADTVKLRLVHDIRDGEFLSAIAYIKRRFSSVFQYDNGNIKGWKITPRVPSLAYVAATPWLISLLEALKQSDKVDAAKASVECYRQALSDLVREKPNFDQASNEEEIAVQGVEEVARGYDYLSELAETDGTYFYINELQNYRNFEGYKPNDARFSSRSQEAIKALKALMKLNNDEASPSAYYAMLSMDGDRFGDLLKHLEPSSIPDFNLMLAGFITQVNEIVRRHNGFVIYVGGEDVLALTPANSALRCATELRQAFIACSQDFLHNINVDLPKVTASTSVCFAHYKIPLSKIIQEGERLLNHVAKTQCGRDAVAVSLWGQGQCFFTYSSPWNEFITPLAAGDAGDSGSDDKSDLLPVEYLAELFKGKQFGRSFLHRVKQRYEELNSIQNNETIKGLVLSDLGRSGYQSGQDGELEPLLVEHLLAFSRIRTNHSQDVPVASRALSHVYSPDALSLLMFVAGDYRGSRRNDG